MHPIRLLIVLAVGLAVAGVHGSVDGTRFQTASERAEATARREAAALAAGMNPAAGGLTAAELHARIEAGDVLVLDARTEQEFAAGHMPEARLMNMVILQGPKPELLEFYDPGHKIVIYCGGGDCDASEKVRVILESYGFTNVHIYKPGWPGWLAYGGPVVTGVAEAGS